MTAARQLADLIEQLVAHGPEELTLPIVAGDGESHGSLLDAATEILSGRAYRLRSVRISDGIWYPTYVHTKTYVYTGTHVRPGPPEG